MNEDLNKAISTCTSKLVKAHNAADEITNDVRRAEKFLQDNLSGFRCRFRMAEGIHLSWDGKRLEMVRGTPPTLTPIVECKLGERIAAHPYLPDFVREVTNAYVS